MAFAQLKNKLKSIFSKKEKEKNYREELSEIRSDVQDKLTKLSEKYGNVDEELSTDILGAMLQCGAAIGKITNPQKKK